ACDTAASHDAGHLQIALAAGAILGTWDWDFRHDRLRIDEALAQTFGLDPTLARDDLRMDQLVAHVHPDDAPGLSAAIAAALTRGGRYAQRFRTRDGDGTYRWREAVGQVDLDPDGRALRFPGVLIDIDQRRR